MNKFTPWLRQPTTIAGAATLFGALSAILSHQLTAAQGIPLLAGALGGIVLPDNSAVSAPAAPPAPGASAGH
jgi:hypothetical protein